LGGYKYKRRKPKNASSTFNDLIRYATKLSREATCHQNLSAKGRSSSQTKEIEWTVQTNHSAKTNQKRIRQRWTDHLQEMLINPDSMESHYADQTDLKHTVLLGLNNICAEEVEAVSTPTRPLKEYFSY
jgi:hypothetical protein